MEHTRLVQMDIDTSSYLCWIFQSPF